MWHIWPGYLKTARASNTTLAAYNETWTPSSKDPLSANWWQNYPKYSVSMLKSFFGERADAHATCDPRFPSVGTTYRVSEHWQTGLMTRTQSWLMELQPQMFIEMSEELARLKGIHNGERVNVTSARGKVACSAIVTKRFKPFTIAGLTVHQVGIPWHYGWRQPHLPFLKKSFVFLLRLSGCFTSADVAVVGRPLCQCRPHPRRLFYWIRIWMIWNVPSVCVCVFREVGFITVLLFGGACLSILSAEIFHELNPIEDGGIARRLLAHFASKVREARVTHGRSSIFSRCPALTRMCSGPFLYRLDTTCTALAPAKICLITALPS